MGGSLPLPGSRQTGWKWLLLLCGIWGVGNFCPRQYVRRCMDRLKVGEKIEKSEAPNAPMCGICQNRTFLSNGHFLQLSNEHIFVVWAYFKMRRRRPPARENPLTPTHGRKPRSSVQAFPLPDARPNKTDAASATGGSVRWCVYGFWGRGSGFRTLRRGAAGQQTGSSPAIATSRILGPAGRSSQRRKASLSRLRSRKASAAIISRLYNSTP